MPAAIVQDWDRVSPVIAAALRESISTFFASILGHPPSERPEERLDPSASRVVSVISLVGELDWTLALVLPERTAVAITEKFCGFAIPFDSLDMADVAGELINVLGGDIVAKLDARGIKAQVSLPMAARGSNVEWLMPIGHSSLQISYSAQQGSFLVKLAARPGPDRGSGR
jgi:CheY-specific phosphatase CheX